MFDIDIVYNTCYKLYILPIFSYIFYLNFPIFILRIKIYYSFVVGYIIDIVCFIYCFEYLKCIMFCVIILNKKALSNYDKAILFLLVVYSYVLSSFSFNFIQIIYHTIS